MKFTIIPGRWYAAELIGDEFYPALRSYSPIRVDAVRPMGTGKRVLKLRFYHANYPEGVRDKVYILQTIERGSRFLLAKSMDHEPHRLLLAYEITASWLREHFGVEVPTDVDIENWLNRNA
jgi:hypothetical protein